MAGHGRVRLGLAGFGAEGFGLVRRGRDALINSRLGLARRGQVRLGEAWRCMAW